MVTIPESHRTLPGLGLKETRGLVFIVRDYRRRQAKVIEDGHSPRIQEHLSTLHIRKHLRLDHPAAMKIINKLRDYGYVSLRPRNSPGMTGNGYDGAIWGAVIPKEAAFDLVDKHFPT